MTTLVAQLLREQCRMEGAGRLAVQEALPLDEDERLTIRPDLIIVRGSAHIAVADTKYKILDEAGTLPNPDAYQLLTYCTRLGLSTGHLIYASSDGNAHARYVLTGSGVKLRVHCVDLRQDVAIIEAGAENLLAELLTEDLRDSHATTRHATSTMQS